MKTVKFNSTIGSSEQPCQSGRNVKKKHIFLLSNSIPYSILDIASYRLKSTHQDIENF